MNNHQSGFFSSRFEKPGSSVPSSFFPERVRGEGKRQVKPLHPGPWIKCSYEILPSEWVTPGQEHSDLSFFLQVTDFGLAAKKHGGSEAMLQTTCGTPTYMGTSSDG